MSVSTTSDIRSDEERVPSPKRGLADEIADNLTALALFVRTNPHLADHFDYTPLHTRFGSAINIPIGKAVDQRAAIAAFATAAARAGLPVAKQAMGTGDALYGIKITFAETLRIAVYGDRDEVCERVVTGTREVTEEVPDPEALAAVPKVVVTKTVEDVKWICRPLLGDDAGAGAE